MNKLILTTCIILLNGCVYEQQPAQINDVSIVEDAPSQPPTSISYPLPIAPQINNMTVNEPNLIPDPVSVSDSSDEEIIIDSKPISKETTTSIEQNNITSTKNENLNKVVDSIINKPSIQKVNKAPMGSVNNPVRFDQSKVY